MSEIGKKLAHPQMQKRVAVVQQSIDRIAQAVARYIVQQIKEDLLDERLINQKKYYTVPFSVSFGNRAQEFSIEMPDWPKRNKALVIPGLRTQMKVASQGLASKIRGQPFGIKEGK